MRDYFCGWYFKCQSDTQTLAIIPAFHKSGDKRSYSIQLITDTGAWHIDFPDQQFHQKHLPVRIGENYFSPKGIRLHLDTPACSAVGSLRFSSIAPIRYDIMGPFQYLPFLECRHSVVSMQHRVNGALRINGMTYRFRNDDGYIEGDRGYSFPKRYAWTHSFFDGGSLMLSVADIPLGPVCFTGVIGVIHWQGKEYRLATYLGGKAVRIQNGEIVIRQGDMVFSANLIEKRSHPLRAPVNGNMRRIIHESAACRAAYSLRQNGRTLFTFETSKASFEYEYKSTMK